MDYLTPDQLPVLPPKVLTFGKTGTGKSTLSIRLLLGLREMLGWNDRSIFIMDTEERAQALVANVLNPSGVPNNLIQIAQTRSIYDARQVIRDASKVGGLVMVDQASHLVDDMRTAHKKKMKRDYLTMYDYGILKPLFRAIFIDEYLYSDIPIFLVARGKDDLKDEIDEEETEKKGGLATKLVNHGVVAKLDGDTAYEAYLNILVETTANPKFKPNAKKREFMQKNIVNAIVEKDNYGAIHARVFPNPQFSHFKSAFVAMGVEKGVKFKAERKPKETAPEQLESLYEKEGAGTERHDKTQVLENITAKIAVIFPKQNKQMKGLCGQVMEWLSGTASWSAWKQKTSEELDWYFSLLAGLANSKLANIPLETWDQLKAELEVIRDFAIEQKKAQEKHNSEMNKSLDNSDEDLPDWVKEEPEKPDMTKEGTATEIESDSTVMEKTDPGEPNWVDWLKKVKN